METGGWDEDVCYLEGGDGGDGFRGVCICSKSSNIYIEYVQFTTIKQFKKIKSRAPKGERKREQKGTKLELRATSQKWSNFKKMLDIIHSNQVQNLKKMYMFWVKCNFPHWSQKMYHR